MPIVVALIALFAPRLVIALRVLCSDYIGRAYHTITWPLLGFLFAPFTTLAYAFAINAHGSISDWYAAVFVIAILMDLGVIGGAAKRRHKG